MADASEGGGTMAGIAAGHDVVEALLREVPGTAGEAVVIAGYNGPRQTVISGLTSAVARVSRAAAEKNLAAMPIRVSHAFHSPLVAPAAARLEAYLSSCQLRPPRRRVVSTVTGDALPADADLRQLLVRQVREPVLFAAAVTRMAADADLLIEVGPGHVLSTLAADIAPEVPVIALETDSESLAGLLSAVAGAYVLGAPVRSSGLFADRFTRPLPLDKEFQFFASPCEMAPADVPAADAEAGQATEQALRSGAGAGEAGQPSEGSPEDTLEILRRLAAERAELPLDTVLPDSHPLDELHLSSITVGQIMNQAAREMGVSAPMVTSNFATSTLADLAAGTR